MKDVTVADKGDNTRKSVILAVETPDGMFAVAGTFDNLLNFFASAMGAVYSWPLVNDHKDWLGEPLPVPTGKAENNGSERTSETG